MTREEAMKQLGEIGRERADLEPLCSVLADLIRTWIASGRDPFGGGSEVRRGGKPQVLPDRPLTNAERCRRWREKRRREGR